MARALTRLPEPIRSRVLRSAFDRADNAFNRGDLEVVFALFAADVEYGPPPPLHWGGSLRGRGAVFDFWAGVFTHYGENTIENISLDEVSPGSFVRRARLCHRSSTSGESPGYVIVQTTDLKGGRVLRQVNILDDPRVVEA